MIDFEKLIDVYEENIELKIVDRCEFENREHLKYLFKFIRRLYSLNSIDNTKKIIIIYDYKNLDLYNDGQVVVVKNIQLMKCIKEESNVILIKANKEISLIHEEPNNLNLLYEKNLIIYTLDDNEEYFIVNGEKNIIDRSAINSRSIFNIPTYDALNTALDDYYSKMAINSNCKILKNIWYDENRLFLNCKPEKIMRDSLHQFLKCSLRNTKEVLVEQNVNDKNPVDIKITWLNSIENALIEIKWLGKSVDEKGNETTKYTKSRIADGSKQLVDYVNTAVEETYFQCYQGWLVVFDCRRKISLKESTITKENAEYYKDSEDNKELNQEFIKQDFNYRRLFLKPCLLVPKYSQ